MTEPPADEALVRPETLYLPDEVVGRPGWRSAGKWVLGGLLVLAVALILFTLSFANITSEGSGTRALEHSYAILIEVDTYLDDHFETLQLEAFRMPNAEIVPPDLPVRVTFSSEEIADADRETFRALLLTRSAGRLYNEGAGVMQEDGSSEVSFFSPQGAIDSGMEAVPSAHGGVTMALIVLSIIAGVLAFGLLLLSGGYGRLVGLGLSVLLAAGPFVAFAVASRFAFRVAADGVDDYLVHEYLVLAQELSWAPVRNGLIFAAGGAVAAGAGFALAQWSDSRRRV